MQTVDENTKSIIDSDLFAKALGIEVLEVKPGWARSGLKLCAEHLNFLQMVHGAVIFSLADAAFAAASNSFGTKAVALSISIDFMSAAEPGAEIFAEVELASRAGKMGCYNMKVENSEGKLIAQCRGWAYHTGKPLDTGPC
jgi:acyl-CoA thioesterase